MSVDPATRNAIIFFALILAALAVWHVVAWRRTRYTLAQFWLYIVNDFFTRVLWRTEVSGPLPVADNQGAVIVCNHVSGIDPLLIQLGTDRVVHWMVAREYFDMFPISYVFHALGSIRVSRGGVDTAATKNAIRLAREGGLVGLFPEGKVNQAKVELLLPGRPGAALIALKAKVPVIPCYVSGAPYDGTPLGSFLIAARARVTIGQPIDTSPYFERGGDKAAIEELTNRFLVEIARLAGVENYEPKLAGRYWKTGQEKDIVDNGNGNGNNAPAAEATAKPAARESI